MQDKIYSFDIFDTCFVRACSFPHNIFDLLAYRVLGEYSSESERMDFTNIRIQAEKKARLTDLEEVTLNDIYAQCCFKRLTSLSNAEIADMEQEVEREQLAPVRSILNLVHELHAKGNNIIYISDMYLPEGFILSLLKEKGFWKDGDKLYVSCVYGKTKRTGSLYDLVAKENNIKLNQWYHYGDNKHSDYKVPKKKGIKAHLVKHEFSYYEKKMLKEAFSPNVFVHQHVAGISKSVRLSLNRNIRVDFAADLIAPLYVSFVYDIMEDARNRGIKKLFFLARDGYILYFIAQQLKDLFPDIELNYLYVSRTSLYFPGLMSTDDNEIISLLKPLKDRKLTDLFIDKINLDVTSYVKTDYIKGGSEEEGERYLWELLSDKKLKQEIERQHSYRNELILKYFLQSGLASSDYKCAIIDVRGTRSCHQSINNILKAHGYLPAYGYYLEVTQDRKSIEDAEEYSSILYSERYRYNKRMQSIGELCTIWEQYFSITNHKRTIGYEKSEDGMVKPVFEENSCEEYAGEILEVHKQVISSYIEKYKSNYLYLHNTKLLTIAISVLTEFSRSPDYHYLKAFEKMRVRGSKFYDSPILSKMGVSDIFYLLKYKHGKLHDSSWKRGSFIYNYPFIGKYLLKIMNHYFFS